MDDNQLLDLDALLPEARRVKLNGEIYDVLPPRLKLLPEFSRKLEAVKQLSNADPSRERSTEETTAALDNIVELIRTVIPTLPADIDLTIEQCNALITLIMDMVVPPEAKALQREGLTPSAQKKTASVS